MDATARETNAHVADGEVAWFWRLDAGVKSVGCQRIAPVMVTKEPDHQEEREGNR
jgi:hypothetical protein